MLIGRRAAADRHLDERSSGCYFFADDAPGQAQEREHMPFFAIQIWTGTEGRYLSLARKRARDERLRLLWPRRRLRIRRRGSWKEALAPIFPGYLFIQSDGIGPDDYATLKTLPGFVRFLPSNTNITPLEPRDQKLLSHFLSYGEIVEKSRVYFDENKRIRVLAGPLKGLEGMIVRVDRRKGRAKVRLEMYDNSFEVDFGFEALEPAALPEASEAPPASPTPAAPNGAPPEM
jgi:transcription termination/antitermination protein NusG